MQAVILAAGRGVRLRPLTLNTPKPLVKINNKPILEYTLNALPNQIDEVILVIGYLSDQIKKQFGHHFNNKKISYVKQKEPKGTFHALRQAKPFLKKEFLVLYADDIYSQKDLNKLLLYKQAILVRKIKGPSEKFGICLIKNKNLLKEIKEKEKNIKFTFANCGAYKLSDKIFKEKIIYGPTGEEYLSSMVGTLAQKNPIHIVPSNTWQQITSPEDIKKAEKLLKNKILDKK